MRRAEQAVLTAKESGRNNVKTEDAVMVTS
jgi:PleD family two-component response regulator